MGFFALISSFQAAAGLHLCTVLSLLIAWLLPQAYVGLYLGAQVKYLCMHHNEAGPGGSLPVVLSFVPAAPATCCHIPSSSSTNRSELLPHTCPQPLKHKLTLRRSAADWGGVLLTEVWPGLWPLGSTRLSSSLATSSYFIAEWIRSRCGDYESVKHLTRPNLHNTLHKPLAFGLPS